MCLCQSVVAFRKPKNSKLPKIQFDTKKSGHNYSRNEHCFYNAEMNLKHSVKWQTGQPTSLLPRLILVYTIC